jgi:2-hydroxy-3-oxopropionate reductase
MGGPMARRLIGAGFNVRAFDVNPERLEVTVAGGATAACSAADAALDAPYVLTMLPDTLDVHEAIFGESGILSVLHDGQVFIDMSTISPVASREMAEAVTQVGAMALDAPVSGGVVGAQTGTLSVMAGGSREAFDRSHAVFEALGSRITYLGKSGSGQAAKLCNQVVVALNILAMCEGLSLGCGLGLDLEALRAVLAAGSAGSWMMDNIAPKVLAGDDSAGFRIDLMLKDLRLVFEASQSEGIPLPGAALARSMYLEARAHGEGGNGNQALYRTYERLMNRAIASTEPRG